MALVLRRNIGRRLTADEVDANFEGIADGSLLGLAIGTDVQAWDANLDQIAALTPTNSNFIVGDGSAWVAESGATVRASLDVPSNAEAILDAIITAAGGTIEGTGAGVVAEKPASATVAAHATTCDVWSARETILSGAAVTFTDLPLGDYVGQVAWVRMNAAHIWTQGAVFTVQGGATYTTAANDWLRIEAITVSTFNVTIFPVSGAGILAGSVVQSGYAEYLTWGSTSTAI